MTTGVKRLPATRSSSSNAQPRWARALTWIGLLGSMSVCGTPERVRATERRPAVGAEAAGALSATGFGETAAQARDNALAALGASIISNVSSQVSVTSRQGDAGTRQRVEHKLKVSSRVLLKGVTYSKPRKVGDRGLAIRAVLTRAAAGDTIAFLLREVGQDPDALDADTLRALREKVDLLEALLASAVARHLPGHREHLAASAAARRRINQRVNQGEVVFEGTLAGATMTLDGAPRPIGPRHFVSPGVHVFVITNPNHRPVRVKLRVAAGQRRVVRLPFVKTLDGSVRVHVRYGKGAALVRGEVEATLSSTGVQVSPGPRARAALRILLEETFTEVRGHRKHRLVLVIEGWRGERRAVTLRAKTHFYSTPGTETFQRTRAAEALAARLVREVVGKLAQRGFGRRVVDYGRVLRSSSSEGRGRRP